MEMSAETRRGIQTLLGQGASNEIVMRALQQAEAEVHQQAETANEPEPEIYQQAEAEVYQQGRESTYNPETPVAMPSGSPDHAVGFRGYEPLSGQAHTLKDLSETSTSSTTAAPTSEPSTSRTTATPTSVHKRRWGRKK